MTLVEDWPYRSGKEFGVLLCGPKGSTFLEGLAQGAAGAGWATLMADGLPAEDHIATGRLIEQGLRRMATMEDALEQLVLVGLGDLGTAAFLQACKSRRVGALMIMDAPLILESLDAKRPIQPLEMLLNLSAPMLRIDSAHPGPLDPTEYPLVSSHLDAAARTHESHILDAADLGVPLVFSMLQEFLIHHLDPNNA